MQNTILPLETRLSILRAENRSKLMAASDKYAVDMVKRDKALQAARANATGRMAVYVVLDACGGYGFTRHENIGRYSNPETPWNRIVGRVYADGRFVECVP